MSTSEAPRHVELSERLRRMAAEVEHLQHELADLAAAVAGPAPDGAAAPVPKPAPDAGGPAAPLGRTRDAAGWHPTPTPQPWALTGAP